MITLRLFPRWLLLPLAALAACSSPPSPGTDASTGDGAVDSAPADRPAMYSAPTCAQPDQAPLLSPDGTTSCTPVGATAAPATGDWPDTTGATEPVVYVRAGASGGTGTRDAPFGDVAAALVATPRAATVALARGTYSLGATLTPTASVTILGAGVGATIVTAPAGMPAVSLRAATGATVVTLTGLTVRPGSASDAATVTALSAVGASVTLRLRDVAVEQPGNGVVVDQGATLCGERLTVTGARGYGVSVAGGAHGYLRAVAVRGGASTGVLVGRSHLVLRDSLVAGNAHDGVALVGVARGGPCTSDAQCDAAPACEGFLDSASNVRACAATLDLAAPARACVSVDAVENVALLGNAVTGLRVQRARPTDDETTAGMANAVLSQPGPVARAARLVVADTRPPSGGGPGGDGIYVGPGATFSLDADAMSASGVRGRLSQILANARAGLLADGDRSGVGALPGQFRAEAALEIAGARVGSNRGPGVFIQNRASASRIASAEVADNAALGLAVTTGGSVALLLDNQFIGTRVSAIALEGVAEPLMVGDGVSIAVTAGSEAQLLDNQFIRNDRVGLLVAGGAARLMGTNSGSGNGFGVALLGGATFMGAGASIGGAVAAAPSTIQYAQSSLAGSP